MTKEGSLWIDKVVGREEMREGAHGVWEVHVVCDLKYELLLYGHDHPQKNKTHLHFENQEQGQMSM